MLYLKDCKSNTKPICVDFLRYNKINKSLIKACGEKNKTILDCTAGLCRDDFILACKNYKITALEKNKVIFALLQDGFRRGYKNTYIADILKNIDLINIDAIDFLGSYNGKYDCVYLDPMFEESKKSRLVKKEMQIFHRLAYKGDNKKLFELAINVTKNRVVVKRALHGGYLIDNLKPSFSVKEKTVRFDVYLKMDLAVLY